MEFLTDPSRRNELRQHIGAYTRYLKVNGTKNVLLTPEARKGLAWLAREAPTDPSAEAPPQFAPRKQTFESGQTGISPEPSASAGAANQEQAPVEPEARQPVVPPATTVPPDAGRDVPAETAPPSESVEKAPTQIERPVPPASSSASSSSKQPVPVEPPARDFEITGQGKEEKLAHLRERTAQCTKCAHLAASRTHVVFGVGNIDADWMFVGEAPGAEEDEQGEPFVGKAGQLLTKMIETTGLKRSDVYIANILKCRPDMPANSRGNRKPTGDEMATCLPYLVAQIEIIQPKVIMALGATAVEGLLGPVGGITRVRGSWREFRGIPVMPTFHPSYLLRNTDVAERRKVWEDFLAIMERLGLPISDKQRGFFAKRR